MEDHEVHVGDRVPIQAGQSHKVANELKYQTRYNIRKNTIPDQGCASE